jgi:hypothetical protein
VEVNGWIPVDNAKYGREIFLYRRSEVRVLMRLRSMAFTVCVMVVLFLVAAPVMARKVYVGSKACQECHEKEYSNFTKYTKKAHSYESVAKMKKDITEEEFKSCLRCHTTGYGEPGGFKSIEETPQLKEAGCEVCHGPGGKHVETEDPADIKGQLSFHDCEKCHTKAISEEFNFKPLIHGGAH